MDFDPEVFVDANQAREDAKLLVKFYVHARKNQQASLEAGRPIYEDREYIDIRAPGSRDGVARPATAHDIQRFSEHYRRFKERIEAPVTGTPLAEWPLMSRSMVEELAFRNVKTVEDLANMADEHAGEFRGGMGFKRQAQEWLADSQDDAPVSSLTARLQEAESQLAVRDKTIADLVQRLEALEAKKAPDLHSSLDAPSSTEAAPVGSDVRAEQTPSQPSETRKRRRRRKTPETA